MIKTIKIFVVGFLIAGCSGSMSENTDLDWEVRVLPSSVRLDPSTNEIIEHRFHAGEENVVKRNDLLSKNWIYNGERVSLKGARGEYVSFQVVISNNSEVPLAGINLEMSAFENGESQISIKPELFLEWAVEVKTPSTGYPKATLGVGWYPDALIPFESIQTDSSMVRGRWTYPFNLPDFNNRNEEQVSQILWVDQFIPFDYEDAKPGTYISEVTVTIGNDTQKIPISLKVWDFAIPNENRFKACLQHEGFLSQMDEKEELKIYQLFKRNRVSLLDPTYTPELSTSLSGEVAIDWDQFDSRLQKYLTGEAFTASSGYAYGPGYGEPIEIFALPFDVYGKHGTLGWPDIGKPDVERNRENTMLYTKVIQMVREHLQPMVNPLKTDLTVYLNGLDESYFPEAWDRMVYFGDLFNREYPEAQFRVDGAYSEEAMGIIGNSIDSWAAHTINYNIDKVKKYQKMGIKDWLYGPMLYESKVNSWVGSSTFIDLPLVNDRAISWSCWKYNTYSWISWGIGAGWERGWYDPESWKDFYKEASEADSEFTYRKFNGNASLIYKPGVIPNVMEVCPSIRLKTMRNGIQEYEYMRLLAELDGHSERVDSIVNSIINEPFGDNSIGVFDVWSFDPEEWDQSRVQMGDLIEMKLKQ